MRIHTVALLLSLPLLAISGWSQSNVSYGEVRGTISDPSGALLSGAEITIVDPQTGAARSASTDDTGSYRILSVSPGAYSVHAEYTGFRTESKRDVRVAVGQTAAINFVLAVNPVLSNMNVVDELPIVEYTRSQQSDTFIQRFIRNLPIDKRTYLSFTLLAPGVADSNALADNTDFRAVQAAHSGISFYGSNGRGNSITVDGAEANDLFGGVRPTLSQEAVQEFQINRSNYSAELGGASGGVVNIVSRSGSNALSGSVFGFFRHHRLDAADPFAVDLVGDRVERIKPPSDRQQFGGTLGFPLRRSKTFGFASFERLVRDETSAVPVLTDLSIFNPTAAQMSTIQTLASNTDPTPISCLPSSPTAALVAPAQCAAALTAALSSGPQTRELFKQNSGVFPFRSTMSAFSTRLDHLAGSQDRLFFRYNYSRVQDDNQSTRALVGFSRSNNVESLDHTAVASWMHVFSSKLINDLRVQGNYRRYFVISNDLYGPEINIAGFGFFNRDITLPSRTFEHRYELGDNLTFAIGPHRFKAGASVLIREETSENHTFLGGRFSFGTLPGALLSPALGTATVTAVQAFDQGLPQLYQVGFGDPAISSGNPFLAAYVQDSWSPRPGLTLDYGVRYERDVRQFPLPTDKNNFAPRFAFAWDPFDSHKTVIRGGYGIFYAPIYYQIDWVVNALNEINGQRQIAQVLTTLNAANPFAANGPINIFRTLKNSGAIAIPTSSRSVQPEDLTQFGIQVSHTGPRPPLTVLFRHDPEYKNGYSQQASFGIERQIGADWSLSASYIFASTLGIPRSRDVNILPTPIGPSGVRSWTAAAGCTGAALVTCFRDPSTLQENVYEATARAFYHGMILEVKKELAENLSITANYTLSKAIDDVTDFNSDFQPNDQTDLRLERALSAFDQRHKLVAYAYLAIPPRTTGAAWRKALGNFLIMPAVRANSSRPFNLLTGVDSNGDRHSTTDRPALAGRNTGIGPNFWSIDARITRRIQIADRGSLELIVEGFNLFNRANYSSVNNTVGPNFSPPFRVAARSDLNPSQPLAYTSVFDPRRLQLGVRLTF